MIFIGIAIGFILGVLAARRYLPELNDARIVVRWSLEGHQFQAHRAAVDFEDTYGLPPWDKLIRDRFQ